VTLSTNIYVQGYIEPTTVFHKCRELIGATDATEFVDDREGTRGDGSAILRNIAGQGLCALLWMHYRPDGAALRPDGDACSEDCDPDYHRHDPMHWIDVDFDTAYSYTDAYGGCGALHARLVFELGQWLDDEGVPWCWRNEFTGEVHAGDDRYRRLADLVKGGQSAMRWFKGTVEPVLTGTLGR
jgi:hypothetical protein